MGRSKLDKTGEINYNNFGSKMIITGYRRAIDIDVYFPEYNWTAKNVQYINFKNALIKCPYEKRYYNIGYLGEGKYKIKENGKQTKCYITWHNMLKRCYDNKFHKKEFTYKNCEVCKEWHNFQNFAKWYYKNYYEVENEKMHLDKDILNKSNKIYSPENCIFVPERINTLFVKHDKLRGDYPIGVCYNKHGKKFQANCSIYDFEENKSKLIHLGLYNTIQEAFNAYKEYKEQNIKNVADYYKNLIPAKLYNAMYDYEVEIID